jgi:hypothetical protein
MAARRVSTRRKAAAKKAARKAKVVAKHLGVRHATTRTVNTPKGW